MNQPVPFRRRFAGAVALSLSAVLLAAPALAQPGDATPFSLPAAPLGDALRAFSVQTGVPVIFRRVAGKTVSGYRRRAGCLRYHLVQCRAGRCHHPSCENGARRRRQRQRPMATGGVAAILRGPGSLFRPAGRHTAGRRHPWSEGWGPAPCGGLSRRLAEALAGPQAGGALRRRILTRAASFCRSRMNSGPSRNRRTRGNRPAQCAH